MKILSQYSQSLFSNNYLQHHLPKTSLWKDNEEKIQAVFREISQTYQNLKGLNLGPGEEANLEDKVIRPVLKALGYEWDVQPTTQRGPKKKRPDYALFKNTTSYNEARKHKGDLKRFFSQALTILEAKYWGRRLNDTDTKDTLDARDPTAQTVKYLDDVYHASDGRIQWAILTNGKEWRIFYYRAPSRTGNFYEVDLEAAVNNNDLNAFKYFYLFFACDAFIPDTLTNKSWLAQHLEGSEAYAIRVSEKLKSLIFDQVFEGLAMGFIEYRRNELGIKNETQGTLKEIFNGCLTLLYRLLFLLYAESRNLLPVEDQSRYYKKSLKRLKEDIVKDLSATGLEGMSHRAYDYWSRLESLCRIIDKGDPVLNVPIYNGGLFQTLPGTFLASHKLADPFLVVAIELLTVDQEGDHASGSAPFIDYSSLGVRHLGDIYEGLLEFHVRVAETEMVEVREKSKSIWKSKQDVGKTHSRYPKRAKHPGEVYIENIKHERRATGSYYTPHYIVEYIVKNTVGPILDERLKKAEGLLSHLEGLYKKQRRQLGKNEDWRHWEHPGEPKGKHIEEITKKEQELFNTLFDIKVLDPAMGSGHFLVHAVDFIADNLITFLAKYPDNPVIAQIESIKRQIVENVTKQNVKIDEARLTEVNLIKRMVMKKCIYGVDINEMAVELAKLSLWLDSFTLGAPLSFLDHHLKCGNSLIGIGVSEVREKLQATLFGSQFAGLLSATELMRQVGELTDATFEDIQKSVTLYERADQELKPFKTILDFWVSEHFGNKGAQTFLTYGGDVQSLLKNINKLGEKDRKLVLEAERLKEERRFFHWELEFPEVFYDATHEKENSGFDTVIGNPPWVSLTGRFRKGDDKDKYEMDYLHVRYGSNTYMPNYYENFVLLSILLLKDGGNCSFIIPDRLATNLYYSKTRKSIIDRCIIRTLNYSVKFPDIIADCLIYIFTRSMQEIRNYNIEIASNFNFQRWAETSEVIPEEHVFPRNYNPIVLPILIKCEENAVFPLGKEIMTTSGFGASSDKITLKRSNNKQVPIIKGDNVNRYQLDGCYYNDFEDNPITGRTSNINILKKKPKLLLRKTGSELVSTIDNNGTIVEQSLYFLYDNNTRFNDYYLLTLLNSKLLTLYFQEKLITNKETTAQIKKMDLDRLPIFRIVFNMPEKDRKAATAKATKLYDISRHEELIKWVRCELSENRNDTIHDFLSYLGKLMIDMNNDKLTLANGFLHWLENEIVKGPIDGLKNKTKIDEFHDHPVNTLVEVLKQNKCIPDPAPSKILNLIEKEFKDIMERLSPLKEKIKTTDHLIDQIVYKLYGLTQEEIQVVEKADQAR